MSDPHETLAHIRALTDAASPGPWFDEERNLDEPWDLTTVYYSFHNGETPDRDLVAEAAYDNAEFIAAARTTVPALVDALEAVLAIHREDLFRGHLSNGCRICGHGADGYPCPTVKAITDALDTNH